MANFIIVIDPDAKQRNEFINTVQPLISPVDGLVTNQCSTADFCAIWAADIHAPISQTADKTGAAVIWGDAIDSAKQERIDATLLRQLWCNIPEHRPCALDGFYAAVTYSLNAGLVLGADLLGLFPVYYYAGQNILLIGSSPELFRHHPDFKTELDPAGLVGLLLTNGLVNGHTLLKSVRRLPAGHLLIWHPKETSREWEQYKITPSRQYFDLPFSAHVEIMHQALDEAVSRHITPTDRYVQLLSGGMDSRMLAGYLHQKHANVATLTLGLSTDLEMQCAVPVARSLGFEHTTANISIDQYANFADLQSRWEHNCNGFSNIMDWGVYPHLKKIAPRLVAGYIMDPIIGGTHITWAFSHLNNSMSFGQFFKKLNGWGINPNLLTNLFHHKPFGELVQETIAQIEKTYKSLSDQESQRAWVFDLYHRQRFHTGSALWRYSFGAWPVVPVIDRKVLATMAGMPAATLTQRRAQQELLCAQFPKLAALPLDRNSYDTSPLRPRLRYQISRHLRHRFGFLNFESQAVTNSSEERRYYYRVYNINGAGWRVIRREAEQYRERVQYIFNKETLAEVLPPPDVSIQLKDGIIDASGLKLLLGILLWSKNNL